MLNAFAPPQRKPAAAASAHTASSSANTSAPTPAAPPQSKAPAHAASSAGGGGGGVGGARNKGGSPVRTVARAGDSSKTRGGGAGRGGEVGGSGGGNEWTEERDGQDAEALATCFSPDSGDQAMRNEVSCVVRGRVSDTDFVRASCAAGFDCPSLFTLMAVMFRPSLVLASHIARCIWHVAPMSGLAYGM